MSSGSKFQRLYALFQVLIYSWYFAILSPLIFLTTLQGGFVGLQEWVKWRKLQGWRLEGVGSDEKFTGLSLDHTSFIPPFKPQSANIHGVPSVGAVLSVSSALQGGKKYACLPGLSVSPCSWLPNPSFTSFRKGLGINNLHLSMNEYHWPLPSPRGSFAFAAWSLISFASKHKGFTFLCIKIQRP